jgi:uncharacterized protein (DUF2384 family)
VAKPLPSSESRRAEVLARAVTRAGRILGLSQKGVAATLGISEATVSRMSHGRPVDPSSKEGELAVLLVRLYRALDSLVGGDEAKARQWMQAHNLHLRGVPAELIVSVSGLVHVVEYLDALRGKS